MLSIFRNATPTASRVLRFALPCRRFAQVVPASTPKSKEVEPAAQDKTIRFTAGKRKVPVKEDHGLYAFFRQKPDANLRGEDRYISLETPETQENLTGRDWRAGELRLKSFRDLHTLWYVLLRERNLLATQKVEARRTGLDRENWYSRRKLFCVRISMARIKNVLNERRLAYEGAVELVEGNQEQSKVLEYLDSARNAEVNLANRRLARRSRLAALRKRKASATEKSSSESDAITANSGTPSTRVLQPADGASAETSQIIRESVQQAS